MAFKYTVKAHPTMYNGVQYRSRLEARWAAFFDLAGWKHEYEPIDLPGWSPDFRVEFSCGHSECEKTEGKRDGRHVLLVEVKPYFDLKQFDGHPCSNYPYGQMDNGHFDSAEVLVFEGKATYEIPADASAAFGANPEVTYWEMSHGSGGGEESVMNWVPNYGTLWRKAGNTTQWKPRQ